MGPAERGLTARAEFFFAGSVVRKTRSGPVPAGDHAVPALLLGLVQKLGHLAVEDAPVEVARRIDRQDPQAHRDRSLGGHSVKMGSLDGQPDALGHETSAVITRVGKEDPELLSPQPEQSVEIANLA